MALNANHTFEDLEGVKCTIIEKNCEPSRVAFLKALFEHNGLAVVIAKSPPPKAAAKPAAPAAEGAPPPPPPPPAPETFTIGVTDVSFSPVNAIYNRELKTQEGVTVTPAYWKQEDFKSRPEKWYWQ
jgi:hypothetical protein